MASLRDFSKSMNLIADAIDRNTIAAVKSVSVNVGTFVVFATPVDTSRARMNWRGSVGSPESAILAPYPSQPSSPSEGLQVALASIKAASEAYNGQTNGVYIANNAPYIQELNNGSSQQAPANFVAMSVLAGVQSIKTVKLLP